ncbi:hypothetical protein Tco_0146085 [Tanacetum coccineum]
MTTLAEHIIVAGAENHPLIIEKSTYDSWASHIRLFIKGKKHGRMMLDSIDNGPLVYLIVEEEGHTQPKKYSELTEAQQLQDDCDVQETNIILHGLAPDVGMAHGEIVHSAKEAKKFFVVQGEVDVRFGCYDSDCDDISSAKAVLMANLSSCDSDVLSKVPYSDTYLNDMINQEESQDAGIQDTNSSAPNNFLVLSFFEQMTDHVANLDKENQINKMVNESLTAELERYKEQQAFWLKHSNYNPDTSVKSHTPVRIEAPSELPKVSLVNESLKKLKYQLASFDKVVKKRTTSDAKTADEIIEVQTVFNQMEVAVDQCYTQFELNKKDNVFNPKEFCASLIAQINEKSVENSDLNAQLQEKVFAIVALKNELRKLKGKNVVDTAISKSSATITQGMFKLDIEPISHRLKNNRDAHEVYLEKTIENTNTLRGIELLVYVSKTCPSLTKPTEKLVAVIPMNKDKKVRFAKPVTSSSNIHKQTDSLKIKDSNKPLLTSTGVKTTTRASGSKPLGNTKKNRISRPPSSNKKNKVEEHPKNVNSSLNKKNFVTEPISNALVKHSMKNDKFESMCAICNKCLFDANHDMCLVDYVNVRSKSKSKRNKMRNVWKPTGKVFTEIGYSWKPTRRIFTIVGNRSPLTRITATKEVPLKETTITPVITQSPTLKVYLKSS